MRPKLDDKNYFPEIKTNTKKDTSSYLSLQDKQILFRILTKRGLDANTANLRIKNLIKVQNDIKRKIMAKNHKEEEIRLKQQQALEKLWNT